MLKRLLALSVSAIAFGGFAGAALAQSTTAVGGQFSRDNSDSVMDRARPDYDAIGVPVGAFLVFPKLELSEAFDDNVYATTSATKSDWITVAAPRLDFQSTWSQNALSGGIHSSTFEYGRYGTEDDTTYGADLNGRLDVDRNTSITTGATFDHLLDPRSDAASPTNARNPVMFDQTGVDFDASTERDRFKISGDFHYRNYEFDNAETPTGVLIDQTYRNNQTFEEAVRGDYAVSPNFAVYTTIVNDDYHFTNRSVDNVDRSSSNDQVDVGTDLELTHLIRAQVQVGYLWSHFNQPGITNSDGVALLGKVEYYPTQLLTLTFNGQRAIQASGVIGSPATVTTTGGGRADYELLRNLVLSGSVQRVEYDYEGVSRTDDDWNARAGANYLITRWIGLNLSYTYYDQESVGAARGPNFADNRVQFGVVLQY